ncbi:MAG: aryl-alcohol dehydrogenase-like predicted oxidoreductase [Gammaproteobacteria bacterium]|jgi:aryl-alcohol dehydrogenase-like predicted oxidoreductase
MHTRKLGEFEVSALGLGCMPMSQSYGAADRAESERALHRALDIGYTFLDTASLYGFGHNEQLLGEVLKGRRNEYILASKCGLFRDKDTGQRTLDGSPKKIKEICEESLKNLQTDVIDLYYLHRKDPKVPIEESFGAMGELIAEGKVRTVGLSEASSETIRRAHAVCPLTAVQSEYSLWTRIPELKALATCRELGITFVPFSPLGRGFLTGKIRDTSLLGEDDLRLTMPRFLGENFSENIKLLTEYDQIATENNCTPTQLALAWLLSKDETVIPIPGTKHVEYVEENFEAGDIKLSATVIQRLDQLINDETVLGDRYNETFMKMMDSEKDKNAS